DVATDVAKASERFPPKSGVMRWSLVARVTFSADSAAGRLRNDSLFQLPIDYDAPLFVLPDDAASTFASSHGTTHTVVTESVGGPRAALARPWALLACALAVAGLGAAWASRREDPALRPGPEGSMWRELARHEEWVTRVQGPVVAPAHPVDVGSLADLVALASEARTRVLFDVSQRVFFVFTQGACYRYRTVMDPGVDERPSWLFGEDAKDTSPVWEDDEEPSSSAPTGG
ncbi:MAG TPA: DUF5305 family protein, partial [Candidatus Thermoplasmatota archaeon]|nr:DUF5305 family protein [Candidatus Thermoplasmatota archaeon]